MTLRGLVLVTSCTALWLFAIPSAFSLCLSFFLATIGLKSHWYVIYYNELQKVKCVSIDEKKSLAVLGDATGSCIYELPPAHIGHELKVDETFELRNASVQQRR